MLFDPSSNLFHATKHNFDSFSLNFAGTGEGTVDISGLYFTEQFRGAKYHIKRCRSSNQGVIYRCQFSNAAVVATRGVPIDFQGISVVRAFRKLSLVYSANSGERDWYNLMESALLNYAPGADTLRLQSQRDRVINQLLSSVGIAGIFDYELNYTDAAYFGRTTLVINTNHLLIKEKVFI
tara:strand:- start:59557 stop:60096 length:540 start_codon:yes stop_codon:yes gene_type:complete